MAEVSDWNVSAGSNTDTPPNGWPEGMAPSDVNNTAREDAARIARWYQDTNGSLTSAGSSDAYTLTPKRTISAYAQGLCFAFVASFSNTGAATLNVSSVGATAIKKNNDQALIAGDIESGQVVVVVHDGTNWQLINPSSNPGTLSDAFALTSDISPTQITANQDDYNPTSLSTSSVIRLDSDAAYNITGLQGGSDGRVVILHNVGSYTLTLTDEDASSTAAYRFALYADYALYADTSAVLQYDSTSSRWRLIASYSTASTTKGLHVIWVPAGAIAARTTNGAAPGSVETSTNKVMIKSLDFDATTQEFAQFVIRMPKSWNAGTVTFIPVWSHASTTTNFGVVWALQGVALSDDDANDTAFGTEQTSTDTGGTTDDCYIGPESSAITIGGSPAKGDLVVFQVKRNPSDGSDTLAVDARLRGVYLLYTTDAETDD